MKQARQASYRQVWVAVFVALLAPAAALPAVAGRFGPMGWLGVVLVIPFSLLYIKLLERLGGGGLGAALNTRWGWLGKALAAVYYLWVMALAALTAGGCVDRLGRTDYGEVPGWLAAALLGLVAAYLVRRGWGAFFRAVEVFFLALAVTVAFFLLLGVVNLNGANLAVQSLPEAVAGAGSLWPGLAALGTGTVGAFAPHEPRKPGESGGGRWLTLWCLVAAGLCALVIGTLGAELTARAPLPFFLALQGIGFPGGFQRLEAMGTAAWVLSDLALIGLAALAGAEIAGGKRRWSWPILLAAVAGGLWLPNRVVAAAQEWLWWVNVVLGLAVPALAALTGGRKSPGSG